jgi:hypothetical protein
MHAPDEGDWFAMCRCGTVMAKVSSCIGNANVPLARLAFATELDRSAAARRGGLRRAARMAVAASVPGSGRPRSSGYPATP